MFPGLGGINPKQMQAMMRQMGIDQQEIDADEVTIKKSDGSKIVIENPSIQKITMKGQSSFQISGEIKEEPAEAFSQADIDLVAEKSGKSKDEAKKALEENQGDIAQAILNLS